MGVHPDKTAWRAVDACGGTYTPEQIASGWAKGHTDALCEAMKAVVDADALTAELLAVAIKSHEPYEGLTDADVIDIYGGGEAALCLALRAAIAKATGAA